MPQHGAGLADQLRSHQQGGEETVAAKRVDPMRDVRDYGTGAQILHELGVRKLRLLSNHPPRLHALEGFELEIVEHIPLGLESNTQGRS